MVLSLDLRPALLALVVVGTASTAAAAGDAWWRGRGKPCPRGAELRGAAPPRGGDIACVKKKSGVFHGPRTTWFDKCSKAKPCPARKARKRFEGEYRRGL
jgi:hypothetical protein